MPLPQTCQLLVPAPMDSPPIRSPQAVHSFIAERVSGLELVEIGTRNGDGMNCFTHHAKHATAIEYAPNYCKSLNLASQKIEQSHPGKGFSVTCSDYRKGGVLDADIITWWEQPPLWNVEALQTAYREQRAGRVRKNAEAILLFDTKFHVDLAGWKDLCPLAGWSVRIPFNEKAKCLRDNGGKSPGGPATCDRAHGFFIVAGFPVKSVQRMGTVTSDEKKLCEKRHRQGHKDFTNTTSGWQLYTEPWYHRNGASGESRSPSIFDGLFGKWFKKSEAAVQRSMLQ